MIFRRIVKYVIAFAVIILILSIFSIYKHWGFMAEYFTNSISSLAGIGLYLLIYAFAFWLLIRSVFR